MVRMLKNLKKVKQQSRRMKHLHKGAGPPF